jgi:hypothetical protein
MAPCEAQWEVDCSVGVREIQEHRSRGGAPDAVHKLQGMTQDTHAMFLQGLTQMLR